MHDEYKAEASLPIKLKYLKERNGQSKAGVLELV